MTIYPPLVWLVNLPPYDAVDWVSVSRQKFSGLVGHDSGIRSIYVLT